MKADFKDGVSKAAGKLSSLASSVMSTIQVRQITKQILFLLQFSSLKCEYIFSRGNNLG